MFASLPACVCVRVWDVFPLYLLCSLARSLQCISKKAPFACPLPDYRRMLLLLTWQFHNVPPKYVRLTLTHTRTELHRSLSVTSQWAAILVCANERASEHAKPNASREWEQWVSVDEASRRKWKRVSQSPAHLRRFSCFRALGAFVWF